VSLASNFKEREAHQREEYEERLEQKIRGLHVSGGVTNALRAYHEADNEGSEHVNSLIKQAQAQEVWVGSADKAYELPEYSGGKEKEKPQDYVTSLGRPSEIAAKFLKTHCLRAPAALGSHSYSRS